MHIIVPVVEGDGEVEAVPILLRQFLINYDRHDIRISRPMNARGRGRLTRPQGLEDFIEYAVKKPGCNAVLLIMDSEGECPKSDILPDLIKRVANLNLPLPVFLVFPHYNFESWFAASLPAYAGRKIKGRKLIPPEALFDGDVESGNGKRILKGIINPGLKYRETEDQASLTRLMDFDLVRQRSRSFRRMEHAFQEIIEAIDNPPERGFVSPSLDRI